MDCPGSVALFDHAASISNCHVSELADHFVKDVNAEVKVGDELEVKLIEIDQQGRLNLSRKRAMPGYVEKPGEEKEHKRYEKRERYKGNYKERQKR